MWHTGRDSNPQPSEPESDALSIEPPVRLPKYYSKTNRVCKERKPSDLVDRGRTGKKRNVNALFVLPSTHCNQNSNNTSPAPTAVPDGA